MMVDVERLVKSGELLSALRLGLSASTPDEVLEFLDAAESNPLLGDVALLVALELAEGRPDDRALLALERSLLRHGRQDAAATVAALLKPTPGGVQRLIDAALGGADVDGSGREAAVAELEALAPTPSELEERRSVIRVLSLELRQDGGGGG